MYYTTSYCPYCPLFSGILFSKDHNGNNCLLGHPDILIYFVIIFLYYAIQCAFLYLINQIKSKIELQVDLRLG